MACKIPEVLTSVTATIDERSLESVENLPGKINKAKEDGVQFCLNENGFYVEGSLEAISSFKNSLAETKKTYVYFDGKEDVKIEKMLEGRVAWGKEDINVTSSTNIPIDLLTACYVLKKGERHIREELYNRSAKLNVKDVKENTVRLRLQFTKKDSDLSGMLTKYMPPRDLATVGNFFAHHLPKSIPKLPCVVIFKCDSKLCAQALVANNGQEQGRLHLENAMNKTLDAVQLLTQVSECKISSPRASISKKPDKEPYMNTEPPKRLKSMNEMATVHISDTDKDAFQYITTFRRGDINRIEHHNAVRVDQIGKNCLEIRPHEVDIKRAQAEVTRLIQDVNMFVRVKIPGNWLALVSQKQKKTLIKAEELEYLVTHDENGAYLFGPEQQIMDCMQIVKKELGLTETRRLVQSQSGTGQSEGKYSVGVRENGGTRRLMDSGAGQSEFKYSDAVTRGGRENGETSVRRFVENGSAVGASTHTSLDDSDIRDVPRKAFFTPNRNTTILIWKADITKMHVDAVVNAANEHLSHGAGVALAIARAAGPQLNHESWQYIQNYGPIPLSTVCTTTAGYMPAKKVFHVVGPVWREHDLKSARKALCLAFYNCLETAQKHNFACIAIPAISSGIYGAPKSEVADMAVQAVIGFYKKFPFTCVKYIHFVDIISEIVSEIQQAFLNYEVKNGFTKDNIYDQFEKWLGRPPGAYDTSSFSKTFDPSNSWDSHSNFSLENCDYKGQNGVQLLRPQAVAAKPYEMPEVHDTKHHLETGGASSSPASTSNSVQTAESGTPAAAAAGEKKEEEDKCSICMEIPTNKKVLHKCKHVFCKDCIDHYFKAVNPKCPNCFTVYGELRGNQPENGTMTHNTTKMELPGYKHCGTIEIQYNFPNGIQSEIHPDPGKPYSGTYRKAYLPDNKEGQKVLGLLKKAFDARRVFTIGTSSTTGLPNAVIWNCIHHKTNTHGGTTGYGYPDRTYLSRVEEELAAQGIK